MKRSHRHGFYEFFAGGGMAHCGLGPGWECLFANDIDPVKTTAYAANWGAEALRAGDVAALAPADLPGRAALAWASFPCQDLSLAGARAGLAGERSGTFWPFWRLMRGLMDEGRAPGIIALENVYGAVRSHDGRDFAAIAGAFAEAGCRFGAMIVDAAHFLPQSRPRLFVIGMAPGLDPPEDLIAPGPDPLWHPPALVEARAALAPSAAERWVWWRLPAPMPRTAILNDVIDPEPDGVRWLRPEETARLLAMMTPRNRAKVGAAQEAGGLQVRGVYKRTREGVQRAEVRADGLAGCLRTPAGGSSRQTILAIEGENVRSRLLSAREAARLMGLPDSYKLPARYNDAYHLAGDGVAVPVVRHLAAHLFEPLLSAIA